MILPTVGIVVSLVFLALGLNDGNAFFLIGSLCLFGLSLGAVDPLADQVNHRASDSLKVLGRDVGFYDDDRR